MSQEIVNSSDSEAVPDSAESRVLKEQDLDLVKSSEESQQTGLPQVQRKFAWWMLPVLGLVLAVGGLSVYRLQSKNSEVATVAERAPLTVRTVAAEEGDIQAWVSSEGTVQAVRFKHLFDFELCYCVAN